MSSFKECRHIMPSGQNCKSPAARGGDFCHFHGQSDQPHRSTRSPRSSESPIDFPWIFEPEDVLVAINQTMQGLASNAISSRRASILVMGIQMAAARLHNMPLAFNPGQMPPIFFSDEGGGEGSGPRGPHD